jgi:hypothetical protein
MTTSDNIFCKYCNSICYYLSDTLWNCTNCKANYLFIENELFKIELRTTLHNKDYIVELFLEENKTQIFAWDSPSNLLINEELVVTLNSILDVTPQTLPTKLKTILTFL